MFRFTLSIALVVFAALTQLSSYTFVGFVKPNLILVILLILSLVYKDWLRRAILIFLAALILKFSSGVETQNVMFIISAFSGVFIIDKVPSIKLVSLLVALVVSTLTINIINFELWTFLKETLYNLLIALSLFIIYRLWLGKYEKDQ